jgi:hypothetical protein
MNKVGIFKVRRKITKTKGKIWEYIKMGALCLHPSLLPFLPFSLFCFSSATFL